MRIKALLLTTVMAASLLAGCAAKENTETPAPAANPPATSAPATPAPAQTDATASASITADPAVFEKAMSTTGTWIICATADMTFDKELVLDGEFKNGKKDDAGKDVIQRKIALYTQDDKRVVTARFTLTAPKLTIKSPNARIQSGTFKGDLYVETADFQLVDAKVEGNIYFKDEAAKAGFKMDDKSSVTGTQEVQK